MKTANLTVNTRRTIEELTKVKRFLDSVGRNSISSKRAYFTGLLCFQSFLNKNYPDYSVETILFLLNDHKIDVYELLDDFVSYLDSSFSYSISTVKLYMAGIRSYLAYYDIDLIPSKFKRKVKMPKLHREDEEPLDVSDIRKILLSCNNRRLKTYLLILASGGTRAIESLAIRLKDIDFSISPTRIKIRKEYSKTRVNRDIYISDEATYHLKKYLDWKYRDKGESTKQKDENDLIFSVYKTSNEPNPHHLYHKLIVEFERLLAIVDMDQRKESGTGKRRKITLHSFRRFVKTVISDQTNQDYSEWFLGHSKSPYYTKKEPERREIYATKCMKYLTFLDYTTLEATGKNIEVKLSEKEKEIQLLRQRDSMNTEAIAGLADKMQQLVLKVQQLENIQK